jgi:rSAM/selenodomain-associated transferase 1
MKKKHDNVALVIFARVPVEGMVKTRIAAAVGNAAALAVYRELLEQTALSVAPLSFHVAFTGHKDPGELATLFKCAKSFFPQTGESLGARMCSASKRMFTSGYDAAVIIGCDIPELTPAILGSAITLMQERETVLGPAADGGYYCVGCTPSSLAVFAATGWGTDTLFNETMAIASRERYRCSTLPVLHDIDSYDDYLRWKNSAHS